MVGVPPGKLYPGSQSLTIKKHVLLEFLIINPYKKKNIYIYTYIYTRWWQLKYFFFGIFFPENWGKIFTHFDEHIFFKGVGSTTDQLDDYPRCDPWDMAYLPTKLGSLFGVNVGKPFPCIEHLGMENPPF